MQDKTDLIINQLANNFAHKLAQVEAEKSILQVELQLVKQEIQELKNNKTDGEDEEC